MRDFKIGTVKLLLESGKTTKEIADDFGVCSNNSTRWKKEYRKNAECVFPEMGN